MNKTKERDSSFELLRIISIAMIILCHYTLYNGLIHNPNVPAIVKPFSMCAFSFGKLGVNIFILITGYFMISKKIKFSKILQLWLEILIYYVGIYIITIVIGKNKFDIKELIHGLMPISFNRYWFMTVYFLLYLLIPNINKYIENLSKEEYKKLLIKFGIILVIPYTIIYKSTAYSIIETYPLSQLPIFTLMYLIGGYIKIYGISKLEDIKKYKLIIFNILGYSAFILLLTVIQELEFKYNNSVRIENVLTQQPSILIVFFSITIFYSFKKMKFNSKLINIISSTTLGIYLMQLHGLINIRLYTSLLQPYHYYKTPLIIVHAILSVIGIVIVGCIIDLLRQYIIEKPIFKLMNLDEKTKKIDNFIN